MSIAVRYTKEFNSKFFFVIKQEDKEKLACVYNYIKFLIRYWRKTHHVKSTDCCIIRDIVINVGSLIEFSISILIDMAKSHASWRINKSAKLLFERNEPKIVCRIPIDATQKEKALYICYDKKITRTTPIEFEKSIVWFSKYILPKYYKNIETNLINLALKTIQNRRNAVHLSKQIGIEEFNEDVGNESLSILDTTLAAIGNYYRDHIT